jgi:hypothetical protein
MEARRGIRLDRYEQRVDRAQHRVAGAAGRSGHPAALLAAMRRLNPACPTGKP